jgi:dipeptidyl aminopeptidase/acylaminoacyl peptidase
MTRRLSLALVAFLTLLLTPPGHAQQLIQRDVVLAGAGIILGGLLVEPPAPSPSHPAMILLHGALPPGMPGAPRMAGAARILAREGYVALALSMRGWPPSGGSNDCGLKQPDDVVAALDWLAFLPEVDPARIGLLGVSQGGQVVLLAAARTKRARAVVAIAPVVDIDRWRQTTAFQDIRDHIRMLCEPGGTAIRSPIHSAEKIEAPVLLLHGSQDTRVPTEQSVLMRDAMLKFNRPVSLYLVASAEHELTDEQWGRVWPTILQFLAIHLKSR